MDRKLGRLAGLLLAVACGSAVAQVRTEALSGEQLAEAEVLIRDALKDPDSAKLRWVYAVHSTSGNTLYCGEVNGKNAFGGFTGFLPFLYNPTGNPRVATSDTKIGAVVVKAFCSEPPAP